MFSFLNFLRSMGDKLKRSKGILFTLILFVAIAGITVSMYYVDKIASDASDEIYIKLRDDMLAGFEHTLTSKKNMGLLAGSMLSNRIEASVEGLSANLKHTTEKLNEKLGEDAHVFIYSAKGEEIASSVEDDKTAVLKEEKVVMLQNSDMISDLDIKDDGVYVSSIVSAKNQENTYYIEYQQNIKNIKQDFEANGKEYIFLLKKNWLNAFEAEERVKYRQLSDYYVVQLDTYDDMFLLNLGAVDMDELKEEGFVLNKHYFMVADVVKNFSGETIGLVVIGEKTESANSIVKIADKIIKSITTVALGLVTSIVLLMF